MPQHAGTFDAVTTCFFIDTAHNIIEYLEVIRHVLKARAVLVLSSYRAMSWLKPQ